MKGVGIDDHLAQRNGTAADFDALPRLDLFPKLDPAAFYGPIGEFVTAIADQTEADPAGVLLNTLAAVGCMMGGNVGMMVNNRFQPPRLFVATVGETGIGRKGTAQDVTDSLISRVDPEFAANNVKSGLSTGEGLIFHVRDSVTRKVAHREKGETVYEDVTDEGVPDKRLHVVEDEFATVLKRMNDRASTVSPLVRSAYDGRKLGTLTRRDPMTSTGAHIAMSVQVTPAELHECLQDVEHVNGFANRFLWAAVRQQTELPEGEFLSPAVLARAADRVRRTVSFARSLAGDAAILRRDEEAKEYWAAIYKKLNAAQREVPSETFKGLLARGGTHILRLAGAFTLNDTTTTVRAPHFDAALAIWDFSVDSVKQIWGRRPERGALVKLVEAHVAAGRPLTRTEQHRALGGHLTATQLDKLVGEGIARFLLRPDPATKGKTWAATETAIAGIRSDSHFSPGVGV